MFNIFLVVTLVIFLSTWLRHRTPLWAFDLLIVLIVVYEALVLVSGTPRGIYTNTMFKPDKAVLLFHMNAPPYIYLLMKETSNPIPLYISILWTQQKQDAIDGTVMKATQDGTNVLVDVDKLNFNPLDKSSVVENTTNLDIILKDKENPTELYR